MNFAISRLRQWSPPFVAERVPCECFCLYIERCLGPLQKWRKITARLWRLAIKTECFCLCIEGSPWDSSKVAEDNCTVMALSYQKCMFLSVP